MLTSIMKTMGLVKLAPNITTTRPFVRQVAPTVRLFRTTTEANQRDPLATATSTSSSDTDTGEANVAVRDQRPRGIARRHRPRSDVGLPLGLGIAGLPPSLGRLTSFARDMEQEMSNMLRMVADPDFLAPTLAIPREVADVARSFNVDVKEDDKQITLIADLPGLDKDDVKVRVTPDGVLTIEGERKREDEKDEEGYHRVERVFGYFVRRFKLPDNADANAVKARVENGVLTVEIPKKAGEAEENVQEIKVEGGQSQSQSQGAQSQAEGLKAATSAT